MNYTEAFVQRDQYRIYLREYTGEEPAIILMHGFPDNLHLYDRLTPCLWPPGHETKGQREGGRPVSNHGR